MKRRHNSKAGFTLGLLFTIFALTSSLAQHGSKPQMFGAVPAEITEKILLQKDEVDSGIGVRFHTGKEEFISVAQIFSTSKAQTLDGVGLKLFPSESNLKGDGTLNYELRLYEVEESSEGSGRRLSMPLRVVPFTLQGEFREYSDYIYVRLPETLPIEDGKAYLFEVALMSRNSSRLTVAISKRVTAADPTEPSGYMIKSKENHPIEMIPEDASGYSLAFFLTGSR